MDVHDFMNYLRAIPWLEAREDLRMIRNFSFPSLKKQDRQKIELSLDKAANPERYQPVRVDDHELPDFLRRIFNG